MRVDFLQSLDQASYPAGSVHQNQIVEYFGDNLIRDFSAGEIERLGSCQVFFIVFTNRSGSNFLSELLQQTGVGIRPATEPFNAQSVIKAADRLGLTSFNDYLLHLLDATSDNGHAGFKISINQLFALTKMGITQHFGKIRVLHTLRRDVVGQAVSHYKARVTGRWIARSEAFDMEQVDYAPAEILRSLSTIFNRRAAMDYYSAIHQPDRLDVNYEDVLADPRGSVATILDFLGLDSAAAARTDPRAVSMRQQRDMVNAKLKRRFHEDFLLGRQPRA
jgi:LPS sulfotransferase NodH